MGDRSVPALRSQAGPAASARPRESRAQNPPQKTQTDRATATTEITEANTSNERQRATSSASPHGPLVVTLRAGAGPGPGRVEASVCRTH